MKKKINKNANTHISAVFSWGRNENGQFLNATNEQLVKKPLFLSPYIQKQSKFDKIISISSSRHHTCFLTESKQLFGIGRIVEGQLGTDSSSTNTNTTTTVSKPILISSINNEISKISAVSCGHFHTLILTENGSIFHTGLEIIPNDYYYLHQKYIQNQLSINCNNSDSESEYQSNMNEFNESNYESFQNYVENCVNSDCKLWTYQQRSLRKITVSPENPFYSETIVSISSGAFHNLAITQEGRIYSWGRGTYGNLGHGDTNSLWEPKLIEYFTSEKIVAATAGDYHSICVTSDGKVYSFGLNDSGQLGVGDFDSRLSPSFVRFDLSNISIDSVSCAQNFTIFKTTQGHLYGCGDAQQGCLALDPVEFDLKSVSKPVLLKSIARAKIEQVECGESFVVALDASGDVYSWGSGPCVAGYERNSNGYNPHPTRVDFKKQPAVNHGKRKKDYRISQIAVGGGHAFALAYLRCRSSIAQSKPSDKNHHKYSNQNDTRFKKNFNNDNNTEIPSKIDKMQQDDNLQEQNNYNQFETLNSQPSSKFQSNINLTNCDLTEDIKYIKNFTHPDNLSFDIQYENFNSEKILNGIRHACLLKDHLYQIKEYLHQRQDSLSDFKTNLPENRKPTHSLNQHSNNGEPSLIQQEINFFQSYLLNYQEQYHEFVYYMNHFEKNFLQNTREQNMEANRKEKLKQLKNLVRDFLGQNMEKDHVASEPDTPQDIFEKEFGSVPDIAMNSSYERSPSKGSSSVASSTSTSPIPFQQISLPKQQQHEQEQGQNDNYRYLNANLEKPPNSPKHLSFESPQNINYEPSTGKQHHFTESDVKENIPSVQLYENALRSAIQRFSTINNAEYYPFSLVGEGLVQEFDSALVSALYQAFEENTHLSKNLNHHSSTDKFDSKFYQLESQNDQFLNKIKSLESENQQLKENVRTKGLQEQISKLQSENDKLQIEKENQKNEIYDLEKEKTLSVEQIKKLESQVWKLQTDYNEKQRTVEELQIRLNNRENYKQSENENENPQLLKSQCKNCQNTEELLNEIKDLKSRNQEFTNKHNNLMSEMTEMKWKLENLKEKETILIEGKKEQSKLIDTLEKEKCESLNEKIEQIRDIRIENLEHDDIFQNYELQIEQLKVRIEEKQQIINQMTSKSLKNSEKNDSHYIIDVESQTKKDKDTENMFDSINWLKQDPHVTELRHNNSDHGSDDLNLKFDDDSSNKSIVEENQNSEISNCFTPDGFESISSENNDDSANLKPSPSESSLSSWSLEKDDNWEYNQDILHNQRNHISRLRDIFSSSNNFFSLNSTENNTSHLNALEEQKERISALENALQRKDEEIMQQQHLIVDLKKTTEQLQKEPNQTAQQMQLQRDQLYNHLSQSKAQIRKYSEICSETQKLFYQYRNNLQKSQQQLIVALKENQNYKRALGERKEPTDLLNDIALLKSKLQYTTNQLFILSKINSQQENYINFLEERRTSNTKDLGLRDDSTYALLEEIKMLRELLFKYRDYLSKYMDTKSIETSSSGYKTAISSLSSQSILNNTSINDHDDNENNNYNNYNNYNNADNNNSNLMRQIKYKNDSKLNNQNNHFRHEESTPQHSQNAYESSSISLDNNSREFLYNTNSNNFIRYPSPSTPNHNSEYSRELRRLVSTPQVDLSGSSTTLLHSPLHSPNKNNNNSKDNHYQTKNLLKSHPNTSSSSSSLSYRTTLSEIQNQSSPLLPLFPEPASSSLNTLPTNVSANNSFLKDLDVDAFGGDNTIFD